MKSFAIPFVLLVAVVTAAVVATRILSRPEAPQVQPPAPARTVALPESAPLPSPAQSSLAQPAGDVTAGMPKNRVLETIQEAAVTYNPAQLPQIEPFLYHSDPEIRQAALDGVVLLGDRAGAKLLRTAAGKTTDATEAFHLREMADYLELPPLPVDSIVADLKAAKAAKAAAAAARPK